MAPWPVMGVPELDAAEHTDTKAVLLYVVVCYMLTQKSIGRTAKEPSCPLLPLARHGVALGCGMQSLPCCGH